MLRRIRNIFFHPIAIDFDRQPQADARFVVIHKAWAGGTGGSIVRAKVTVESSDKDQCSLLVVDEAQSTPAPARTVKRSCSAGNPVVVDERYPAASDSLHAAIRGFSRPPTGVHEVGEQWNAGSMQWHLERTEVKFGSKFVILRGIDGPHAMVEVSLSIDAPWIGTVKWLENRYDDVGSSWEVIEAPPLPGYAGWTSYRPPSQP